MAYTAEDVRRMFLDAGASISTPYESEAQRLERIASQLNSGLRDVAEVQSSIQATAQEGFQYSATASRTYGGPITQGGSTLNNVPGDPDIWKVGDDWWLVYVTNGPDGLPVYGGWQVPDSDLPAIFGPGVTPTPTLSISDGAWSAIGALDMGSHLELANFDGDPFATWEDTMARAAITQPWILDADYQRLILETTLEGRSPTEWELQNLNFYRNNSQAQREWMKLLHSDPQSAAQFQEDNRIYVAEQLRLAGVENPSSALISYMADQVTVGNWSTLQLTQQVKAIADPASGIEVDAGLRRHLTGAEGTTRAKEDQVKALALQWLGPVYGNWDDGQIKEWAGRIRNDPDGVTMLTDSLRQQRLALFPEYEDTSLTYQDIAAPWRSFGQSLWGQKMDETSTVFLEMLKNNDAAINGKLLRQKGLQEGIGKVVQDAQSALLQSVGGSVRNPL